MFGSALADSVLILYGGSVNPANVTELMSMPDCQQSTIAIRSKPLAEMVLLEMQKTMNINTYLW